jgi:hypothetical protein
VDGTDREAVLGGKEGPNLPLARPLAPVSSSSTDRPSEAFTPDQLSLTFNAPQKAKTAVLRSFHARSHVTVPEALAGEKRAKRQEDAILEFFRLRPCERFTPSEVSERFPDWPLTSTRRAMTNLSKAGYLTHYKADRKPGPFGAAESSWGIR